MYSEDTSIEGLWATPNLLHTLIKKHIPNVEHPEMKQSNALWKPCWLVEPVGFLRKKMSLERIFRNRSPNCFLDIMVKMWFTVDLQLFLQHDTPGLGSVT